MPYRYIKYFIRTLVVIDDKFSITLLIKTFGVPWHRHQVLVGYFMGIAVRIIYLPIAIFVWLLIAIGYLIFVLAWLVTPIIAVVFIFLTPFIKG